MIYTVFDHHHPFNAHSESEALIYLGVQASAPQDLGMGHARSQNFDKT